MSPRVVLVGAPGSGKSTIGKLLAEKLRVDFSDTDELIEKSAGKSISAIFVEDGEAAFRKIEAEQVAAAVAQSNGVVSLGGGAVLNPVTRELLKTVPTLWLEVSQQAAASRVGLAQARPVLVGNVRSKLVQLLQERTPLYQEVAAYTVETSDKTESDVLAIALEWVQSVN